MGKTIIENINSLINTKNELNAILNENGVDGGEIFSEYPSYFRSVIAQGGGGSDKVSYSYLEEKLSYYPTYSYVDENYVSYSYLGNLEDITYYIIGSGDPYSPENVYATKFELTSYVKTIDLQSMSYVSITDLSSMGYITSNDLPVIDENIIPKTNNTYTLGSSTYKYKQVWANNLYGSLSGDIYNATNLIINLNNTAKYRISSDSIRPNSDNTSATLGTSDYKFGATYTSNIYTDTAYLQDTSYSSNIVPNKNETYTLGKSGTIYKAIYSLEYNIGSNSKMYNDTGGFTFIVNGNNGFRIGSNALYPRTNKGYSIGSSSNKLAYTYTSNIYTDTAYISSATYLPVNTYWYDGNSYHWVGDLFN